MALDTVNEKTTAYVTASFKDKDGNLAQPTTSSYTVHDEDTGAELVSSTALSPTGGSVEIVLSGNAIKMHDETKTKETHVITVNATYAGGEELNAEFRFRVINLSHVSST